MKKLFGLCALGMWSIALMAQSNGMKKLPLQDMSSFQDQAGNWQIVGAVVMNPTIDIHAHEEPADKKSARRKKKEAPKPKPVVVTAGAGVLVNLPSEGKKSNLLTSWEHGDIELDLEVMLPKGSNSGLYLQGRYEVQLYDSWGVKSPGFSDIGGIYRNWESAPEKIYMGKAPLENAAKAPGLWQRLTISFKAPRFDADGNKIANARIVKATLNGITIHENVELPLPTGGPVQNNEVPMGPIMIQGDHGAVAVRNFQYRLMHDLDAELVNVNYQVFYGNYESFEDVSSLSNPDSHGQSDQLTYDMVKQENDFAIEYNADLVVTESANYSFKGSFGGTANLVVDGEIIGSGWRSFEGAKFLEAGTYPVEITYFKNTAWLDPYFGLFIASDNGHQKPLHAQRSHPVSISAVAPILIQPEGNKPRLLRAFLDFEGDRDRRITHSIGVGIPSGINFVYDLGAGNLACVWKGGFVDATPMWHSRGDGSFKPLGMTQYLFLGAPVQGNVHSKGYKVDSDSGLPTFIYELDGKEVQDKVYADESNSKVIREVKFDGLTGAFEVTESDVIDMLDNGMFVIGDQEYYIEILSGQAPEIQKKEGKSLLLMPIDSNPIKYAIIW